MDVTVENTSRFALIARCCALRARLECWLLPFVSTPRPSTLPHTRPDSQKEAHTLRRSSLSHPLAKDTTIHVAVSCNRVMFHPALPALQSRVWRPPGPMTRTRLSQPHPIGDSVPPMHVMHLVTWNALTRCAAAASARRGITNHGTRVRSERQHEAHRHLSGRSSGSSCASAGSHCTPGCERLRDRIA